MSRGERQASDRDGRAWAGGPMARGIGLVLVAVVAGVVALNGTDDLDVEAIGDRRPTTTVPDDADRRDRDGDQGAAGAGAKGAEGEGEDEGEGEGEGAEGEPEVREPSEYSVLVANGAGVAQAAARFSEVVTSGGFQTAAPTDAEPVETSTLYFVEGFRAEASRVAALFDPPPAVAPMPDPPPVPDLVGASVVLVVGPDLAKD